MQGSEARPGNPALKQIVVEASQALARLDAPRLEELALSCQALTRTLSPENSPENPPENPEVRKLLAGQAEDARGDLAVFARVLNVTRANLDVMNRLRELRAGRVEYSERQLRRSRDLRARLLAESPLGDGAEARHGDD